MSQQHVQDFFRLLHDDPHLAERVHDIPDAADAPGRLLEIAASVGLPFTLRELYAERDRDRAGFQACVPAILRRMT
ncbi:Nif11-like leader peptide family natural product precursor [Pigmentiphaga litoralis]|uniref:Nif11-like leader peptide family natural product precursor n=1 Tax=Pigmentiphaga litoralis TaxID=516702 RepID=UPI003B42F203